LVVFDVDEVLITPIDPTNSNLQKTSQKTS